VSVADGRALPWRVLGRIVKPYALAVSFATFVVSWAVLAGVAIGQLLDTWPGQLVGAAGFGAVILLWAGWWAQRDEWMAHGLLVTVGVWSAVWAIVLLDTEWSNVSGWLAFGWVLASSGAWALEVTDKARR
jgi:ABC-type Mn2+/Zn2+ transport system permease subunit